MSTCIHPTNLPGTPGGRRAADPAQRGARLGNVSPTPQPPLSRTSRGATRPPRPGHTVATALPTPVASCPAAVPSLRSTVPRSGNLPPKGRAEGWVRHGGQLAAPRAPAALPQPQGCAQKSSLVSKNLSGVLHCCPQCHPQPHRELELAAASIRSFGDRNSAAKEKFNPCREKPLFQAQENGDGTLCSRTMC